MELFKQFCQVLLRVLPFLLLKEVKYWVENPNKLSDALRKALVVNDIRFGGEHVEVCVGRFPAAKDYADRFLIAKAYAAELLERRGYEIYTHFCYRCAEEKSTRCVSLVALKDLGLDNGGTGEEISICAKRLGWQCCSMETAVALLLEYDVPKGKVAVIPVSCKGEVLAFPVRMMYLSWGEHEKSVLTVLYRDDHLCRYNILRFGAEDLVALMRPEMIP